MKLLPKADEEELLRLARRFGIRRMPGSTPTFIILGIDWILKPIHIKLSGKKRIAIW